MPEQLEAGVAIVTPLAQLLQRIMNLANRAFRTTNQQVNQVSYGLQNADILCKIMFVA